MQIIALAIYKGKDRRVLRFHPGQMNVVTGWPGTGKSSLLEIVEYCLGRTEPTFARGALDVVEWYGLLLEHAGTNLFVARPAPADGASSNSSVMLLRAATDVVDANDLSTNTDTTGLRETLGQLVGVEGDVALSTDSPRETQRPSIGQALLLCFQRQSEIAKPDQLFHRTNEDQIPRTIRESLPYFLGAVGSDHVSRRFRLLDARRELRRLQSELDQIGQVQMEADVRAAGLVAEAKSVGLLGDGNLQTASDASALKAMLERPDPEVEDPNAVLRERLRLRTERRNATEELRQVQEQRAALVHLREEGSAFRAEVGEQRSRLRSLELMATVTDGARCPLCTRPLPSADPTTEDLSLQIASLDARLANERSLQPYRLKLAVELRERARHLRHKLNRLRKSEEAILGDESQLASYTDLAEQRAFVRGRASQFVEALLIAEPGRAILLERRKAKLEADTDLLEKLLDPAAVAREVESKLSYVDTYMTGWARELGLEHSSEGIRLNIQDLTLFANDRRGPIPLIQIGSAANQVGYHVVAHLALHRWFIEERRPVPDFLFLDQPEQAYYPEDVPKGTRDLNGVFSEKDQQKVLALYELIRNVTADQGGAFQTIVVGHWNPANVAWFPEVCVANWRGDALVPAEWLHSDGGQPSPDSASAQGEPDKAF